MNVSDKSNLKKVAIIMAGGSNLMLWPRSTEKIPKQFLRILSNESMVESTVNRLIPYFDIQDIFVVTSKDYAELIINQIPALPNQNLIIEPYAKHTAPCLALTLSIIEQKYSKDTIMMAFPSDHHIINVREFHNSLDLAAKVAHQHDSIVTIGVNPSRPETAYGYVQVKEHPGKLGELFDEGVRLTATFAEKPDALTAKSFVKSGDFLWNSGIFIMRIEQFWSAFALHLPEHDKLFTIVKKTLGTEFFEETVLEAYMQMESVSMDYAILEKADNVFVVQSAFGWSDMGSWDEVYRLSLKDGRNNVLMGDVISLGVSNSLVVSDERLIGILNVDNLIVIDSPDSLLICKKDDSASVQELINFMKRKQIKRYL